MNLFPIAGTRDFFPSDCKIRQWLFSIWTKVSTSYGFEPYDAPIVESKTLYTRKGGEDIVEEMYTFEKGGIELALRPEMTPSLVRMIKQFYHSSPYKPLKWFSIPQCWRYETTIRGRKREHYQWNVDIFGAFDVRYEIELLQMLIRFFKEVGLGHEDIQIHLSNRKILQVILNNMGIKDENFEKACIIIDKINKLPMDEFKGKMIEEIGLEENNIDIIMDLIKVTNIKELEKFMPTHDGDECLTEIKILWNLIESIGIIQWITFDVSIVRGLSYYTGFVFEAFFVNSNIKRAVCGGGRYDNIMKTYGFNQQIPAIGFGFGDVVILEVLGDKGLLPKIMSDVEYVVIPFNDNLYPIAHMVSEKLRDVGKNVITYAKGGKRGDAFTYADKVGASVVIYIAPDEWVNKQIVVKYLHENDPNRKQLIIDLEEYMLFF